jgi:hypothetical protein
MLFYPDEYTNCRGHVVRTLSETRSISSLVSTYSGEEERIMPEQLRRCFDMQQINYSVSQLPLAAKCPPPPHMGPSRTLPFLT